MHQSMGTCQPFNCYAAQQDMEAMFDHSSKNLGRFIHRAAAGLDLSSDEAAVLRTSNFLENAGISCGGDTCLRPEPAGLPKVVCVLHVAGGRSQAGHQRCDRSCTDSGLCTGLRISTGPAWCSLKLPGCLAPGLCLQRMDGLPLTQCPGQESGGRGGPGVRTGS